jgi:hypothetical protein
MIHVVIDFRSEFIKRATDDILVTERLDVVLPLLLCHRLLACACLHLYEESVVCSVRH